MKKAFVFGIVALLALAVFSCDNIPQGEGRTSNVVGYTDDGRAIVELELGTGSLSGARGLSSILAQAGADYYEVVFEDSAGIYRTNWREGKIGKLRVPLANYDNSGVTTGTPGTGYAYIFAGRYSDRTLLGVGKITATSAGAGSNVTAAVTSVTFEITPFEATVSSNVATSSFVPATFSTYPIKINEIEVPVFLISDAAATTATYKINSLGSLNEAIKANGTGTAGYNSTDISKPFIWDDGDVNVALLSSVAISTITADGVLPISTSGLTITVTPNILSTTPPKARPGLAKIYFDIPVYLHDKTEPPNFTKPIIWNFRGGLNNKLVDMGNDLSLGGAILVGIGPVFDGGAGSIEIHGKY